MFTDIFLQKYTLATGDIITNEPNIVHVIERQSTQKDRKFLSACLP